MNVNPISVVLALASEALKKGYENLNQRTSFQANVVYGGDLMELTLSSVLHADTEDFIRS